MKYVVICNNKQLKISCLLFYVSTSVPIYVIREVNRKNFLSILIIS